MSRTKPMTIHMVSRHSKPKALSYAKQVPISDPALKPLNSSQHLHLPYMVISRGRVSTPVRSAVRPGVTALTVSQCQIGQHKPVKLRLTRPG